MASNSARNLVHRSISSAKTVFRSAQSSHSVASAPAKLSGIAAAAPRRRSFFSSSRLPVELGCGESLMPLHSVTASALLNSKLSSKIGHWSFLSEGSILVVEIQLPRKPKEFDKDLKYNIFIYSRKP
ncbi:hypothetical protein BUALT_Bualt16G0012500 [Buddleja alternifolia]|uniref:Uncharacterized protein n=1 Tax=Buddleja alternifolia TaxID=168488 RepID=A0AAV6W5V6_9LAMI|nr:hypothetical protein BUALT_Bualt16G0012500 [Buddleja alternifolia]